MRGAAGPPPPPLPPAAAEEASGGGVGGGGLPVLVGREECAYARCYCEVRRWVEEGNGGWIDRRDWSGRCTHTHMFTPTHTPTTHNIYIYKSQENVFHLCRRLADALSPGRGGLHPSPLTDNDDGRAPLVAALFISNARKCVPIWGQRRGEGEDERVEDDGDEPVLWDYHGAFACCCMWGGGWTKWIWDHRIDRTDSHPSSHQPTHPTKHHTLTHTHTTVVCLLESPAAGAAWVYDLDTTLQPFPVPAATYIREAFRPQLPIRGDFRQ